jgi:ABC-2 type transport system ATP-binding protein
VSTDVGEHRAADEGAQAAGTGAQAVGEDAQAAGGVAAGRPGQAEPADPGRPVVLSTHDLTKRFGKILAVDHLNLQVHKGDVFGFLGPNGAGKTTTIRMIFGLIFPTSGHVQVLDHRVPQDRKEAARHMGGFVEVPAFYPNMSARRNLSLLGSIDGHVTSAALDEVLGIVGLRDRAGSKVGGYSHGMKQRLGIAAALLSRPELIILDEPTSGLDPQGMKDVRELVRELGRSGTTVFLSSHLLHEVEQVCNRAAIINKGRTVIEGPVSELRPENNTIKVLTADQGRAADVLRGLFGGDGVKLDEGYLLVKARDDAVPELVRRLVADGVDVRAVVPSPEQGLEDFFLGLTQSSDVDAAGASDAGSTSDAGGAS